VIAPLAVWRGDNALVAIDKLLGSWSRVCRFITLWDAVSFFFQFLYINVLNYRYFRNDSSTFLFKKFKKNVGKIKKTLKTRFYRKIKRMFINFYCKCGSE